jgi:hypothetical protein
MVKRKNNLIVKIKRKRKRRRVNLGIKNFRRKVDIN